MQIYRLGNRIFSRKGKLETEILTVDFWQKRINSQIVKPLPKNVIRITKEEMYEFFRTIYFNRIRKEKNKALRKILRHEVEKLPELKEGAINTISKGIPLLISSKQYKNFYKVLDKKLINLY